MGLALWRIKPGSKEGLWKTAGWEPYAKQRAIHDAAVRVKLVSGGERAGKSEWTAMEMLPWAAVLDEGLLWIIGPDYEQARQEFRYLLAGLDKCGLLDRAHGISMPKVGSWQMWTRLGTEILTKTGRDPTTLASRAPDGIAIVEAAQCEEETYTRARGRVAEKRSPLVMSGTFERGRRWYAEKWRLWQGANLEGARSFSIASWDNIAIYPGGRNDPEILALEAALPKDVFQERHGATPVASSLRVMRDFDPELHVSFDAEFDANKVVQLWVDPGYAHPYAILAIQRVAGLDGANVNHVDEIWERGLGAKQMIALARKRVWWPNVRALVLDVAGKQHPSAESQEEIWMAETGLRAVMQYIPIADGILRHRTYLLRDGGGEEARPKLLHHPRNAGTIWEYDHYLYSKRGDHRAATELPVDRDNDSMKALAYGIIANFGHATQTRVPDRKAARVVFKAR